MWGWYRGRRGAISSKSLSEAEVARREVDPRVMLLWICGVVDIVRKH